MDYIFGISWKGVLIFLLPMIPNIVYFILPKVNYAEKAAAKHFLLDIIEHGSQAIFVLILLLLLSKQNSPIFSPLTFSFVIILFLYYILWIFYFRGIRMLPILLGLAVLPVAYFILAEIWLHNYPAVIPTVIFGVFHTIITCVDSGYFNKNIHIKPER